MTLVTKINGLASGIALFLVLVMALFSISREYQVELDQYSNEFTVQVMSQPDLQASIYLRNKQALTVALDNLLSSTGAISATIHDSLGQRIIRREKAGAEAQQEPLLSVLLPTVTPSGVERVTLDGNGQQAREGWVSAIFSSDSLTHFTTPVFSTFDPQEQTLSSDDLVETIPLEEKTSRRYVMGYVHVAISPRTLITNLAPRLYVTALVSILLILLSGALSYLVARRIAAALSRLVEVADSAAVEWLEEPADFSKGSEIEGIATVLNGMTQSLAKYKASVDDVHEQLGISVEETKTPMDRRTNELDDAVREIVETKARLQKMAYYDSLTSLPNRRLFSAQLDQLLGLAESNGQQLALLYLDLDNFKRVNDSLGHEVGDQLLKEIAARLLHCIRESDLVTHTGNTDSSIDVSRLEGDVFTIVLNQVEIAGSASDVAQRIIAAVKEPIFVDGHELAVSCSVGIALAPGDASNTKDLLQAADTALFHAKKDGKNNFAYYQDHMAAPALDQLRLERDLRGAIERNELSLHYQPQIDSRNGAVVGAEALLRWNHPKHGVIPPLKFIPLAEEMGLIGDVGKWTLEEACRQLRRFGSEGLKLPKITVNISALQFNSTLIPTVKEVLNEFSTDPGRLQLELTEDVILEDVANSVRAFNGLKALGVKLSIDNFGTGYSSLRYLGTLPLDELKIDRSFVMKSQSNQADANLTIAMIAIAHSMKLDLVAEGVENIKQYRFLRENGADVMQGYLFSAPVSAEKLASLLVPGQFKGQLRKLCR